MYHGLYGEKSDLEYWYQHGGNATVASYGRVDNIPQHHLSFLSHCVRFFETDTHLVVFWKHLQASVPPPHANGKIAVVGHTPQSEGDVLNLGHLLAIDTYCYGDQWLSAVDVESGMIWQANNRGDLRTAMVEEKQESA